MKKVFIGKIKKWEKVGTIQTVLRKKGSPEMAWLAQAVYGVSEDVLMAKIAQEVFKGDLKKPLVADSVTACIELLGKEGGAIGILSADAAKSIPASVAILSLE